ncbi:General stress protein 69 [Methylacidimicrobium cyclopophantes]|uniref:General stress protein 69 n=1 Tax=Methylacidimicrobium cyclopophantes TaxID=1041766 RepID=A0A5E6MFQ1_9BACT|nr:aldo/keto reductase [Methylacidimicrobium cyclopophantes]VVM08080.1 General stress protein 69 [Methylacidimicrobium cyclopophantes]
MELRSLGKTGLLVSPLGLGAAEIGFTGIEQGAATELLHFAIDHGVNVIDTAAGYATSEERIGKALGPRRRRCVLVSKCGGWTEEGGIGSESWTAEQIGLSIDRSLRRLRTEHIDVMLLHSCDRSVLERGEALGALRRAQEAGKVRFLGYSGDGEAAELACRLPELSVIETSINICDQANLETVLPAAREARIGVLAKRSLANGAWRPIKEVHPAYREYVEPYADRFRAMNLKLDELGAKEMQWPEVALRFVLAQSGVHVALAGSACFEHLFENLEAARRGALPEALVTRLRQAFLQAEQRSGKRWSALR